MKCHEEEQEQAVQKRINQIQVHLKFKLFSHSEDHVGRYCSDGVTTQEDRIESLLLYRMTVEENPELWNVLKELAFTPELFRLVNEYLQFLPFLEKTNLWELYEECECGPYSFTEIESVETLSEKEALKIRQTSSLSVPNHVNLGGQEADHWIIRIDSLFSDKEEEDVEM